MENKPLMLLIGKSGSGKDTVADYLALEYGLTKVKSYTTRKPRYDKEDTHIFLSERIYNRITDEEKVAQTVFDNHLYCATYKQLQEADIYIVDKKGLETVISNKDKIRRDLIIVYLDVNPIERLLRMWARKDFFSALNRVIKDVFSFKNIEEIITSNGGVTLTNNDSIETARKIKAIYFS